MANLSASVWAGGWLTKSLFTLMTVTVISAGAWGQAKVSLDSKKLAVAVMPLDAVALAARGGTKVTIKVTDSSATREESAPNLFADKAAIDAFADAATQKVVNAFVKVKRIRVVERTMLDKILKEQNFQMTDLAQANQGARIGELLGAEFIVQGQLQQASVTQITEDIWGKPINEPQFSGTVELTLRLIDVSSGEVTSSKDFKGATGFLYQKSPSEAAYVALNDAEKSIGEWLRNAFPAQGIIFEIRKEKKGEAKEVVITCGKDLGIKKDDVFKVMTETEVEIDGKKLKRTSDVGKLVVTKLEEDGNFARCDVDKGGKDISTKFAAGTRLVVVQTKK